MQEDTPRPSRDRLQAAVKAKDPKAIDRYLSTVKPADSIYDISHLTDDEQSRLLQSLTRDKAAGVIEKLPTAQVVQMLERLSVEDAAAILSEMPNNEQADVISRLDEIDASAVLKAMPEGEALETRRLMAYPPDSAGGLMITEYLAYYVRLTVDDVLDDLRKNAAKYRRYEVQYAYVVSSSGQLVGVLPLRDLLLSSPDDSVAQVMIVDPLKVRDNVTLEELERFFERHPLLGVPVVDEKGIVRGVVRNVDVEQAAEERSNRSFLQFMGIVGGEELRSMPLRIRSMRRLSWLSVNIVLNILAASVIAFHQDTLAAAIALAVFLPIISDMSGCSGNQAVAVSMRELTLGLIRPSEVWRVFGKEVTVGLINGVVLGILLGIVGWLWQGNYVLGAVVAAALAANTLIAVCFGGLIPLVLRGLGQDPALASGPILTTVTDMSGFFLVLTLARAVLPWLTAT
jgi:magnesium transporter